MTKLQIEFFLLPTQLTNLFSKIIKRIFVYLQLELEIEQHVLSTTIKLSDGTTGHVFSRGPKNESQMFLYNCHLCGVPNLPGERCLQTHIAGRKHQTKLSSPMIDAESFRAPLLHRNKGKSYNIFY